MIEITLLGTGSPLPDPNRAGPSTLVRVGGQVFLVDCGRGVLQRAAAVGVGASGLTALLLTHLHSDHIGDPATSSSPVGSALWPRIPPRCRSSARRAPRKRWTQP